MGNGPHAVMHPRYKHFVLLTRVIANIVQFAVSRGTVNTLSAR